MNSASPALRTASEGVRSHTFLVRVGRDRLRSQRSPRTALEVEEASRSVDVFDTPEADANDALQVNGEPHAWNPERASCRCGDSVANYAAKAGLGFASGETCDVALDAQGFQFSARERCFSCAADRADGVADGYHGVREIPEGVYQPGVSRPTETFTQIRRSEHLAGKHHLRGGV